MTLDLVTKTVPVRELQDGDSVDLVLLVRESEAGTTTKGDPYLSLKFTDKTGAVDGRLWDDAGKENQGAVERFAEALQPGKVVRVAGDYKVRVRDGRRYADIAVSYAREAKEDEIDWDVLLDGPARPVEELEAAWRALMLTVTDERLTRLLDAVFDAETWKQFRVWPAAKNIHQAHRHGLLEHTLLVAESVARLVPMYGCDYDVAVTGAMVHDIAKLEVYTGDPLAIDYTDDGNLFGELPLSYYRVRRAAERVARLAKDDDPFDANHPKVRAVLHIILSHHGKPEWGSPVVPATREATLVHHCDLIGGRLGSFDRLEKALPPGQQWSDFDRALGVRAFFGHG